MPDVNELYRRYRDRDNFALISVSMDHPSQYKDTRALIREHGIRYPILRSPTAVNRADGCGWYPGNFGVPTTFIIDPQGTIFDKVWVGDTLIEELDYLLDQESPLPPLGISVNERTGDEGGLAAVLQLYNPHHTPLDVKVWGGATVALQDEDGNPAGYDYVTIWDSSNQPEISAEFDRFGDFIYMLAFPLSEATESISYGFDVIYPGTESLFDGEGLTIGVSEFSSI